MSLTSSSIPLDPTLRSAALNTVVVVPLLSNKKKNRASASSSDHSMQSLFDSLSSLYNDNDIHSHNAKAQSPKEVTLIVPNSNLTPPGEWRYDETPLKSHDWSLGCQRLHFIDGQKSLHAKIRHESFRKVNKQNKTSHYGEFLDLYPSRGIASVIGVISVKDCQSIEDLHAAEEELQSYVQQFTPILYSQQYWDEAFDSPIAPKHFVTKRLFVFDSFDDENEIDLSKTTLLPDELVAFPPLENMHLHLNLVVNNLAVAVFIALEKKIKILDGLNKGRGDRDKSDHPAIGDIADIVGPNSSLNEFSFDEDDMELVAGTGNNGDDSKKKVDNASGKMNFGRMAANAVKALQKGNGFMDDVVASLPPIQHELQTPLDFSLDEANLTKKDVELLYVRNAARREKHGADFALMAGSAIDAYDRYTRSAELAKQANDPLWYAASLEGIASSFVAMSDTGGHGADKYLDNNFQYPDEVMLAALTLLGFGSEGKDGGANTKIDKTKTTMARAVYALLEETHDIYSRNVKLVSINAELLLKTAWYIGELEGLHVRCRWGYGLSSIGQEVDNYDMENSLGVSEKRWELTEVSKIDLLALHQKGTIDATLCKTAVSQCQKFAEVLHEACAIGDLDAFSRAAVATRCARLCLKGVRVPQWIEPEKWDSPIHRENFPRKAAFFTTVAAESMSQCSTREANICSQGFWAAAAHLYSKAGNKFDGSNYYAWATLRATIYNAISRHNDSSGCEKALEKLLLLLGECTPKSKTIRVMKKKTAHNRNTSSDLKILASSKPNSTAVKKSTLANRASLFPISSTALAEQSKWVLDDANPMILLPLVEPSSKVAVLRPESEEIKFHRKLVKSYITLPPLISLHAVIPDMNYETCIATQKLCISTLAQLRKTLPTTSPDNYNENITKDNKLLQQVLSSTVSPLEIASAKIIKSESHLLLDKLKAAGFQGKSKGSLATFFNPYAKQKNDNTGKNIITLVAQGEERTIAIEFNNSLAVPLEIPNCQLVFDNSGTVDVDAPPLCFTLPPKTKGYSVHFPFIVASLGDGSKEVQTTEASPDEEEKESSSLLTFEAIGIRVSAFNRSFFIPFDIDALAGSKSSSKGSKSLQVPKPVSTFQSFRKKSSQDPNNLCVNLEAVPAQPNLLVSFATSPTPLEDAVTVPVHLSDGEIFTIPPFRLENDFGSSGHGRLERLQIVGVGMPGLSEEILFDTDQHARELEEEEDRFSDNESENDDFDEMMEGDGLPPLKMKCLAEGLSLSSINDKGKSLGEGSILSFQMAATHDMGDRIKNGGNVRIRFRYRGPSPTTGIEIWRKREIALKIVKVKGPRISSLTFRSDLSWGSSYADLCYALAKQKQSKARIAGDILPLDSDTVKDIDGEVTMSEIVIPRSGESTSCLDKASIVGQVGRGNGVYISSNEVVILMAVANDTGSTIVLSNRSGVVGGFEGEPMPTVRVSSGVSVKIPVVIPRINCFGENGEVLDIADELIGLTALQWESEVIEEDKDKESPSHRGKRQGRVRIPSRCLKEMIEEHPSFIKRICKPPINVNFNIDGIAKDTETNKGTANKGEPIEVSVRINPRDWIPSGSMKDCVITLELCCARKNSGIDQSTFDHFNDHAYIWCGQVSKSFTFDKDELHHKARLCFTSSGDFVVSACGRMNNGEVWWAPTYQQIKVL